MTQIDEWSATVVNAIAQQVRRYRKKQGLSAQGLADRTDELGFPVPRNVIANLENGRREAVSITELLVLAGALNVPLLVLLFPVGAVEAVEPTPGEHVSPWEALRWASGESSLPSAAPDAYEELRQNATEIRLYREEARLIQEWQEADKTVQAVWKEFAATSNTTAHAAMHAQASSYEAVKRQLADKIATLRNEGRRTGVLLQELPEDLSHIDQEGAER